MQTFPAYKITHADLDRLKAVAARVFDRSISPQSRMEIVARSAGFKTYASFLATLKEHPILLWGDQYAEECRAEELGLDRNGIPYIQDISLNEIISAGLAWSERNDIEGAMMRKPEQRLEMLKTETGKLADYLDFLEPLRLDQVRLGRYAYRSSLTFEEVRNRVQVMGYREAFPGDTVILVSPRNQAALGYDFDAKKSLIEEGGPWMACRVHLTRHDPYFEVPAAVSVVDWADAEAASKILMGSRIMCFDEEDVQDIRELGRTNKVAMPYGNIEPIKAKALSIEEEEEGDFFTLGYYGAARMEMPRNAAKMAKEELARLGLTWLCEMVQLVHGCDYELRRMMAGEVLPPRVQRLLIEV